MLMACFARIAWVGHIWLTALMTLVAGMPHFACRCPDGPVKPFCLGPTSGTSGCCCSGTSGLSRQGTCCRYTQSPRGADQLQARSCCQHQARQSNGSPGKQPEVGSRGCTRTLTASEV